MPNSNDNKTSPDEVFLQKMNRATQLRAAIADIINKLNRPNLSGEDGVRHATSLVCLFSFLKGVETELKKEVAKELEKVVTELKGSPAIELEKVNAANTPATQNAGT